MEAPTIDPTPRLAPEAFAERAQAIEREVGRVIVGQRELVRQTLTGLLANSHVLLEGVPGLGKTMLVRTIADVIDCTFNRIQFTPDLTLDGLGAFREGLRREVWDRLRGGRGDGRFHALASWRVSDRGGSDGQFDGSSELK